MPNEYAVTVQQAHARPIAAVRVRVPIADVSRRFAEYLNQVYAAARARAIEIDGQNIFVYRDAANGQADIEFGVGARRAFDQTGPVVYSATPAGAVATTTHWGEYAELGAAHHAVVQWCLSQGRALAGPRWEVYGHWSDNPATRRTDVFYLVTDDENR